MYEDKLYLDALETQRGSHVPLSSDARHGGACRMSNGDPLVFADRLNHR